MKIINSDQTLQQFIPNTFATVEGETSLFEKLYTFLEQSEQWATDTLTGTTTLLKLAAAETDNRQRLLISKLIVSQALLQAIPSLDLVLTPNGFGIVSTSNIAPASKERVSRLIDSIEQTRDNAIEALLLHLPESEEWLESSQATFFSATLFPTLSLCDKVGIKAHRWQEYIRLREQVIEIETDLAATYFSTEQLESFRHEALTQFAHTDKYVRMVIQTIRMIIIARILDRPVNTQTYYDIVNVLRQNPLKFPEWHASQVASLFEPPKFENKKQSGGFWL